MSRHIFETTHQGQRVQVVLGWDRPLQYVFMTVENLSASDDEGRFLYSNLDEGVEPGELTLDHFRSVLRGLGLNVPEMMFAEVDRDRAANVGNRVLVHTAEP